MAAMLLPYLGVFFVLLMGSGLIEIPSGSPWFPIIKFVIFIGVLAIGIWAWATAKKNNLPPIHYLQLSLFVPFTIDFHLHHAFIILTVILFAKKLLLPWNSLLKPIYLLFIWGAISYVCNQFVEFNPLSFLMFFGTFFLPFIFLGVFRLHCPEDAKARLLDFFYSVVLIMILVIGLQILFFRDLHPDMRTGGTRMTTHAAFFLSMAFLGLLFKKRAGKGFLAGYQWKEKALLVLTLPVIFLIDAKYELAFLGVSVFSAAVFFGLKNRFVRVLILLGTAVLIALWYVFTDGILPLSELAARYRGHNLVNISRRFSDSPKAWLIRSAVASPKHDPLVFIMGSGPGTFLSRAASSRTPTNRGRAYSSYGWQRKFADSYLPGFIDQFESKIKKKYWRDGSVDPQLGSLFNWGSSLLNMFFETGLIGLLIFIGFFVNLAMRAVRALESETGIFSRLSIISLVFFLFLMSLNELWYEQPTFQIMAYAMMGLFFIDGRIDRFTELGRK